MKNESQCLDKNLREYPQPWISALYQKGYIKFNAVDEADIFGIAQSLGEITFDKRHPVIARIISPQKLLDANPNTLSSRYGSDSFPFHTDGAHWKTPPRYLILYCNSPGEGRRLTKLIDTHKWELSVAEKISFCSNLYKTAFQMPFLCTVGQVSDEGVGIRFDRDCMTPLTSKSADLLVSISQKIDLSVPIEIHWQSKDMLIFDNQRILHSRGSPSICDADRKLMRILIGGHYDSMGQ